MRSQLEHNCLWGMVLFLFGIGQSLNAQIDVSVRVDSGFVATTCTDNIGAPDPLIAVEIEGGGFEFYPQQNQCFNAFPNVQYGANYTCPVDLPATVQVCFRALENDSFFALFCEVDGSCEVTECQNIAVPAIGDSLIFSIAIPDSEVSSGEVFFTILTTATQVVDNDLPCDAVDFGSLVYGDTLGDLNQGLYSNQCATNVNEPNPIDDGIFTNDAGVWFQFTTGPDPSGLIIIDILNDPENTGDKIDTQAALYTTDTGDCDGAFTLVPSGFSSINSFNSRIDLICPMPNTTYYLLVDGNDAGAGLQRGVFSVAIRDIGEVEGGDLRCEFEALGEVTEGGCVATDGFRSNYCATDTQDPFVQAFVSQHSVWFQFIAPPSGHVYIEGISDTLVDSIGIQIGVYRSFNNTCSGPFGHIASQYTANDGLNETMELTCLYAGRPYWILIDGSGNAAKGLFTISVCDAGDIRPRTTQDTVLCAGETFQVGNNFYSETGTYFDTLQLFAGCDSLVTSNVTVLDEIMVSIDQTQPANGETATGIGVASASGGDGNYTYLWCSGETTPEATMLLGGANCCVTVTDGNGCEAISCIDVEFVVGIFPTFTNDTLDCYGDTDGLLTFSLAFGLPPYSYSWQNSANTLNGSGTIAAEGDLVSIPNLPAGDYTFMVNDAFFDTSFVAQVWSPEELVVDLVGVQGASCFGICDGTIEVIVTGGTGAYTFTWSNGANTQNLDQLCAGEYSLTVTDENNCDTRLLLNVNEPPEFLINGVVLNEVSCFGGSDGEATIDTQNGTAMTFNWSNGEMTPVISDLSAGFFDVTVVNTDGCEAYASVQVVQPAEPLTTTIAEVNPVSCFGEADATLEAVTNGPGNNFTYLWSSGSNNKFSNGLSAGEYSVMVINENGCEAMATYVLDEPDELEMEAVARDITCLDADNDGAIHIDTVTGGTGNYSFSLNGSDFNPSEIFSGLEEGSYEVTVRDGAGCETYLDITVQGPPELLVDLGEDVTIHLGESLDLTAITNSPDAIFLWKHQDSLQTQEVTVTPMISTVYNVQVIDTVTFCQTSDNIFVLINRERRLFIPNVFSPNSDGRNDEFRIFPGPGIRRIKTFRIFSRGGNMVYQAEDFEPEEAASYFWDGEFRGQLLNPGVFVYFFEIEFVDGLTEVYKGDVLLMR
ncbi:MAG: hypothetical protein DHS20C18_08430 [Saprospiraceae bacterium]|nr:MAG: hypothetical protein DHS20C18_08430 [Saprospiraceae bacterium]